MKNKKIVVFLLIAVMVLGFTLTALVGCSGFKDLKSDDEDKTSENIQKAVDFLNQAVENTVADKNLNELQLGATIKIDTTYGDTKKSYSIDVAAALALSEKSSNTNQASLEIKDVTDKKNNKNVLSAYYQEGKPKQESPLIYLKVGENKFMADAVNVRAVMEKNKAFLGDEASKEIGETVTDGVSNVLNILFNTVGGFDGVKIQKGKNGKSYRLEINLGDLINGLLNSSDADAEEGEEGEEGGAMIQMVGSILNDLGLDLQADKLAELLPTINVGLTIKVSSTNAKKAQITGISADLSCAKKEIVINKKGEGKSPLLDLAISNDFKATASIDLAFGKKVKVKTDDFSSYPAAGYIGGILNFTATGSFEVKNDLNLDIMGILSPSIPKGVYELKVSLAANPAPIVNLDFTQVHSLPHAVYAVFDALEVGLDMLKFEITNNGADFLMLEISRNAQDQVALTDYKLDALGLDAGSSMGGMVSAILKKDGSTTLKTIWEMVCGMMDANENDGYILTSTADQIKSGIFNYKVDTDNGYVDDNNDNNPDKDENGNFKVKEGYALNSYGIPQLKSTLPGYVQKDGKWVVDTENGYTDSNNDGIPDTNSSGFVVGRDYVLYNGRPVKKSEAGYKEDGTDSKGNIRWAVDTENGYVETKAGSRTVKLDGNGNFVVNEEAGYVLFWKDGMHDRLRPVKKADLSEDELADYEAMKAAAAEEEDASLIPPVVADIISLLSIVAKGGAVNVSLQGYDLGDMNISGGLTLDKNGVSINATVKGLDGMNGDVISGMPAELGIVIKFTGIKYGNALN